jgi:2-oxoisovalerate dehydrogenase E1 component
LLLALGLGIDEALASTMMRTGSLSEGRDVGVVFNLPRRNGPCVLPACGGVGTQYTPSVGWAQALRYRAQVLGDESVRGSIALVHGGEASTSTNGFWAALNIATTQKLPILFYIEDNRYGISVTSDVQTPGGNIAANLQAYRNLEILQGDGCDPFAAADLLRTAVESTRTGGLPCCCVSRCHVCPGIRGRIRRPTSPPTRSPPSARAIRCRSCASAWCRRS